MMSDVAPFRQTTKFKTSRAPTTAWWPALWEGGAMAMAILSPMRTYLQVNPAFGRLMAAAPATLITWTYEQIGHPLDLDVELDAHIRLADGMPTATYHRRFRTGDGTEFFAQVHLCSGPGDQVLQIVLPEMKPVETDSAPIGRLLELGAILSHGSLEPVRQISVQAGLLLMRGDLDEPSRTVVATIECAALRSARQLRRLAVIARLDLPKVGLVPMRPLIEAAWRSQPTIPTDVVFTVMMPDDLCWVCDPAQITIAVGELLVNAIAYRSPIRPLMVVVEIVATADHCTISVADNGRGIIAIDQPRLFHIGSIIGSDAGAGVGLALVRAVAEGHHGLASLASEPCYGTRVMFTLAG